MTRLPPEHRPLLRSQIMHVLYEKEQARSHDEIQNIIICHCVAADQPEPAFKYMGKVHTTLDRPPMFAPPLHECMHERMNAWLANQVAVVKEEMVIVANFITAVLNTSDSAHDWLRLLPAAVHEPIRVYIQNQQITVQNPPMIPTLTQEQVDAFLKKQERFLNMLKGRLALNLFL